jgi:hypothetical protein
MNNLFIKTAEACSQVYVGESGVNPSMKKDFEWQNLIVKGDIGADCGMSYSTSTPYLTAIITIFLFFFLIKKRKNMQKTFTRTIALLGIILLGFISLQFIVSIIIVSLFI